MQGQGLIAAVAAMWLTAGMTAAQEDMRPPPRPGDSAGSAGVELAAAGAEADAETEAPATELAPESSARLPSPRPDDLSEGHELEIALTAVSRGDWDIAAALAAANGPVAADIVEWMRLRRGEGDFPDYRAFLARNTDWPGLDLLRQRGESSIPEDGDPAEIIAYFADQPPQTGRGALRLALALEAAGRGDEARAEALRAWRGMEMGATDEAALLDAFGDTLAPAHADRLSMLIWERDRNGTLRAMARADADHRALAEARIALQQESAGVDTLIGRVPEALRDDGGLAYDRMIWRIEKRRRDEAADLIISQSTSAERLGRPEAWAEWRRVLARQEMRNGNGQRAYDLASSHHIPPTDTFYPYADLEWLSGYLALTYLDDPATALAHFRRHTEVVETPISLSRGHYWEGRALEAMGDSEASMAAYRKGAEHQTAFYGLLSAEKAGVGLDPALTGRGEPPDWREAGFVDSTVFKAAVLLFDAGERWETVRFLSHLAEITPVEELEALGDFTLTLGDPFVAVRVSKQIVSEGVVPIRAYFPLQDLGVDLPVEEALALAIARRESEFNIGAVSPAGARGMMQLMPGTAKLVSGQLGMPYRLAALTTDPVYNATLGSAYLAGLIEEFGPNYALVSAGYNAGPGRPRSWVELYGDPRYPGTDPVDWVEHIPFRETRNYVMRVTESVPVYRARLTGEVGEIGLTRMLTDR